MKKTVSLIATLAMVIALIPTFLVKSEGALRTVAVSTDAELKAAMDDAKAGDEIVLKAGVYNGTDGGAKAARVRAIGKSGTAENPITIKSEDKDNPAKIVGENNANGVALYIQNGDYWVIEDLEVIGSQKGIVLDNSNHSVIRGCYVHDCGQEAIHLRDDSSYCLVTLNRVENTGLVNQGYGEAVYVGSAYSTSGYGFKCDYNVISHNILGPNIAAECIDVKEYTTGTIIEYNTFHGEGISGQNSATSHIMTKGNDAIVRYNTFNRDGNTIIRAGVENFSVVDEWGYNNIFYGNTFNMDDSSLWQEWPGRSVFSIGIWSGSAIVGENTYNTYEDMNVPGMKTPVQCFSAGSVEFDMELGKSDVPEVTTTTEKVTTTTTPEDTTTPKTTTTPTPTAPPTGTTTTPPEGVEEVWVSVAGYEMCRTCGLFFHIMGYTCKSNFGNKCDHPQSSDALCPDCGNHYEGGSATPEFTTTGGITTPEEDTTEEVTTTTFTTLTIPVPHIEIVKGDINLDGDINITDAVEILKYVAGLKSKIESKQYSWYAALIVSEDEPKIADAIEILKYVAGLPNVIQKI